MIDHLLAELARRNIRLWVDGSTIRYDAPHAAMTPPLADRLREHRAELLTRIGGPAVNHSSGSAGRLRLRPLTTAPSGPVIFLIPGSGVGPRVFDGWRTATDAFELVVVHLPGREALLDDQPFTDVAALAEAIAEQILEYGDRERVILGHSLGSLIGREVAKRLSPKALRLLVVVADVPPDRVVEGLHPSDDELLDEMRYQAGVLGDESALENDSLAPFLPAFRADLAVRATCHTAWSPDERVDVPMLCCFGAADVAVTEDDREAWRHWTTSRFRRRTFDGDHYFALSRGADVVAEVLDFFNG